MTEQEIKESLNAFIDFDWDNSTLLEPTVISFGKLMYNKAVEDCANSAEIKHVRPTMTNMDGVIIDTDSILKNLIK